MFSDKIKAIREKEGLTQDEFAREIFVSRTAVTKWETGKCLPSIDTVKMISEKYGVSIDELLHNEIESSFYKTKNKGIGDLELNRKQKIIACIVFFLIVGAIFVTITVKNISKSPSVYNGDEMNNFNESMKKVPKILNEWTEEKGYLYKSVSHGWGLVDDFSQSGYEIYESKEDKEAYLPLYKLDFYISEYKFTPRVVIYGDDPDECLEEAFVKIEEIKDLIKRLSGRDLDMSLIRKMTDELLENSLTGRPMKEELEEFYYAYNENSIIGLEIEKIDPESRDYSRYDGWKNDYCLTLSVFMDYHEALLDNAE